jgi:hypothetical protein
MEKLAALIQWFGAPIVAVAISGMYLLMTHSLSIGKRIAVSAHGFSLAVIYLFAAAAHETGHSRPEFVWPFLATFVLPVTSIVLSLVWYPGRKMLHLLLVPLLYCALWIAFIGSIAVTGDWL